MSTNVPTDKILRMDRGAVNARILARSARADFRRVEAASLKMDVSFASAEGKRYYLRFFHTLQINAHFISLIARTRLDEKEIGAVETVLRHRLDAATQSLNERIDGAEALFGAHAIASAASYDTVPLRAEVMVVSSLGRRFLEALLKLDQLMPLLQTLEIFEIIDATTANEQRFEVKQQLRKVANQARSLAVKLRARMDELDAAPLPGVSVPAPAGEATEAAAPQTLAEPTEAQEEMLAAMPEVQEAEGGVSDPTPVLVPEPVSDTVLPEDGGP